MTGRLTALTPTDGTIASDTSRSCSYTFPQAQFYGDWDQLQTDYNAGHSIHVNFHAHADTGTATVVRRLPM